MSVALGAVLAAAAAGRIRSLSPRPFAFSGEQKACAYITAAVIILMHDVTRVRMQPIYLSHSVADIALETET